MIHAVVARNVSLVEARVESFEMEVPVYSCVRCGAPLSLEAIEERACVRCLHCDAETTLDEAARARVLTHLAEVRNAWRETLVEAQRALHNEVTMYVAVFVLTLLFSAFPTIAVLSSNLPVGRNVSAFALGLYLVIGLSARRAFRAPSAARLLASGIGACGRCGGPVRFEEGESSARCRHCRADCLVNPTLKTQMITAAGQRLQIAVVARQGAERKSDVVDKLLSRFGWILLLGMIAIPTWFALHTVLRADFRTATSWEWGRPVVLGGILVLVAWGVRGFNRMRRKQLAFDAVLMGLTGSGHARYSGTRGSPGKNRP